MHPKVISERLGHASVTITLDTYSHASPAIDAEAAGEGPRADRVSAVLNPTRLTYDDMAVRPTGLTIIAGSLGGR